MKFWNIIETAPEAAAARSWKQWLDGPSLDAIPHQFNSATMVGLLRTGRLVDHLPCEKCGCSHRVHRQGATFAGICECGKGCEDMRLSAAEVSEWQLNPRSLGKAVAKAFDLVPTIGDMGLNRTMQIALHGAECLPIILTIQPDLESFRNLVCQLSTRLSGGFILLAPTQRFADDGSLKLLDQANARLFDLESNLLQILANGKFRVRISGEELFSSDSQPTRKPASEDKAGRMGQVVGDIHKKLAAVESGIRDIRDLKRSEVSDSPRVVLENIHREVIAGRVENRHGFEKVSNSMDAVAQGNHELRKENDELRRFHKEGYFKFALIVDAEDFQAFAAIMVFGNRKAAAERLKIPFRSFYDRVKKWAARGKEYQLMMRYIEWRKRSGRHIKLRLEESVQSGESGGYPENPETLYEILETGLKTSDNANRANLLADILNALQAQNPKNWMKVRDELVQIIQEELPQ